MIEFEGDSGEYEFLIQAVEMSKGVDGLCLEIGLRLGKGTATIIDAVSQFCPDKKVVAVDPYGSILYEGREGQICRLDYTNDMRNTCLANMYPYSQEKGVKFHFIELTDKDFFDLYATGVIIYDLERHLINKYSMVHLDGPHNVKDLLHEISWFNLRMDAGAVIVLDDITPDFFDLEPVEALLFQCGWGVVKKGNKKGLYIKN